MAYKDNEKTLNADIDSKLADTFESQRQRRKQVKKGAIEAAIRLWVDLPAEVQARLIEQSLDASSLVTLVREIVDEHIEKGFADGGRFLTKRRKSRRKKKG